MDAEVTFQSLKGLILTTHGGNSDYGRGRFQSLKGLILTFRGFLLHLLWVLFQSLKGLILTAYEADDVVAVLSGSFEGYGHLASGQNVAEGAPLKPAAAGELTAATANTDVVVAVAMESVDASAAAAWIKVRWTGR